MPLYSDYETRPVRLEPSHEEVDMATLLRDAALAGGLGGAVGLGAGRAMIPYEGLPPSKTPPSKPWPKSPREGEVYTELRNALGLDEVEQSYRRGTWPDRYHGDAFWGRVDERLGADDADELWEAGDRAAKRVFDQRWPDGDFTRRWYSAPFPGSSFPGDRPPVDLDDWAPVDLDDWARKAHVREATKVLAGEEGLGRLAFLDMGDLSAEALLSPEVDESLRGAARRDWESRQRGLANDALQVAANQPPQPGRLARLGAGAGRFAKAALNPVNIATDLLLGSAVGAGSAGLGYASAAPESAGLFTAPGPGYEGLVTPEDIEAAAEARKLLKEQERQRLLEQYRASGYDLDPNTRLRDLR